MDMLGPEQGSQTKAYAARALAGMLTPDKPGNARSILQAGGAEVRQLPGCLSDSKAQRHATEHLLPCAS